MTADERIGQSPRRVLVVKTSSMGDVIHAMPALEDAARQSDVIFDWLIERPFAPLVRRHRAVAQVLEIEFRRWRRQPWRYLPQWRQWWASLRAERYDLIIDAQGLIKSRALAWPARGPRCGMDQHSCREPLAAWYLQHPIAIERNQHAVERQRQLFAAALGYAVPTTPPHYGLRSQAIAEHSRLMWLHGASWSSKQWPWQAWRTLTERACAEGFQVQLAWGNTSEWQQAERICQGIAGAEVLPALTLDTMLDVLSGARAAVGVDTGLSHLAVAVGCPLVALFGPTDPQRTAPYGAPTPLVASQPCMPCLTRQCRYVAPGATAYCMQQLTVETVWQQLCSILR